MYLSMFVTRLILLEPNLFTLLMIRVSSLVSASCHTFTNWRKRKWKLFVKYVARMNMHSHTRVVLVGQGTIGTEFYSQLKKSLKE